MNAAQLQDWLTVRRGEAPLLLSIPHAGTDLAQVREQVESPWLATLDADWWVEQLYDFAGELDATIVATAISRTVIDVNRDPSSCSLYPGMASTELVPTTTFDGTPLYRPELLPSQPEQLERRLRYFDPYHAALRTQLARLKQRHGNVVLYDAHAIRSHVPRLFEGELPLFNIGTFEARSCSPALTATVLDVCQRFSDSWVVNGRFKGGYITRHYGQPAQGVHAIQVELACRAYLREPSPPFDAAHWPIRFDRVYAQPVINVLREVLEHCIHFAGTAAGAPLT